ncbi:hypothetical protein T069G_08203 [Trichoderma breve]|uniref:Uncharacterized protein n=1 Tax=Trichoderma breve TaxID=2034170 RepID=A0A9W9BCZ6_9HYPO|nr:hypothetical protein T069G_08203 [Trichoderma breve]KAJ4857306.1 hypothetical protein T069G_08203 [Trichoderma breve]
MTSSKPIASRPYIPGGLVLSDLKKYQQLERFYTQNMGFIEEARKLLSQYVRNPPDFEKSILVKPRPSNNEHPKWTWKPLRGRMWRLSGIRGKKRKRESDDGCFHPQKNRLLEGGAIKQVTEEEMKHDDIKPRSLREILYPELEDWGIDPAEWPTFALEELEAEQEKERKKKEQEEKEKESFGDLTSDLSDTLDNLTIFDGDDTVMRTPYTSSEFGNDSEVSMMESISDWGDWYRARRRDFDSSITIPLRIDVDDVDMDELPIDSGGTLNELISLAGQAPVVPEGFIMNELFGLPGQDPFIPGDVILEESFPLPGQAPVIPEDVILQEVFPAPDHAPVVPEDAIRKESFTSFRQASLFPQDIILKESFPPPDNAPAVSGDVIPQESFTPFRQASLFPKDITLKESFPAPDHAPVVFEDVILKDSFPPPGYAPAVPEDVIWKEWTPPPGQAPIVPQDVILQDVFPAPNYASAVSEGCIMNHLFPLSGQAPSFPEGVILNEPFPPPVHAPVVPVDARLKEVFGTWQEYRMEAAPEPECSMGVNDEAEDANDDVSMKAETEASWETATERGIGAEREVEGDNKAAAENDAEAEKDIEFEQCAGFVWEETGKVTTEGKANVGKRTYDAFEEAEVEDADASASGEETGTVKATVGKRTYEEFEEDEIDDADASASGEETRMIRVPERTETETETADYSTQVEEAEEKKGVKETDDVERMEAREPTPEDAMEGLEEMTSEIAYMNIVASEPEPAPSTPTPPSTPTQASRLMRKQRSLVTPTPPSTPTPASRSVPKPRSSVPESAVAGEVADEKAELEFAYREMQSLADQVDNIADNDYGYAIELCDSCRQVDEDIAEHVRDVRERIMEELLVIEQKLRPYCIGE